MFIVGITGGMGAGKTTLMKLFENKRVPCFYSDDVAKNLIASTAKQEIIQHFGPSIKKPDGTINKKKLSAVVFSDKNQLQQLNSIIHPKVDRAFDQFKTQNHNSWLIAKEAAILIESGTYKSCDYIVLVTAPKSIRKQRIMRRNKLSSPMVEARMEQQWSDDQKRPFADFVIESTGVQKMKKDFEILYDQIKILAKS